MTFEERKAEAEKLLVAFLSIYTPTRGVSPEGLAQIVTNISDAMARRLPAKGDFQEHVEKLFMKIRDTHMSNTWPTQAVFVSHMPAQESLSARAAETFKPDSDTELYSQHMRDGLPVPEAILWGVQAGALPRTELERYRSSAVLGARSVYGNDARKMMENKYGAVVLGYFEAKEAA